MQPVAASCTYGQPGGHIVLPITSRLRPYPSPTSTLTPARSLGRPRTTVHGAIAHVASTCLPEDRLQDLPRDSGVGQQCLERMEEHKGALGFYF